MNKLLSFLFITLMLIAIGCDTTNPLIPDLNNTNDKSTDVLLVSIEITPENSSILPGENLQYIAVGIYDDYSSEDITDEVSWSSSNDQVVSIDSSGLATAVSTGTTIISADLGAIHSETSLTLTNDTMYLITIEPIVFDMPIGYTKQYSAIGYYLDGSARDITDEVIWSSSDPTVATIDETGFAEGISMGAVEIKATKGPIEDITQLVIYSAHVP